MAVVAPTRALRLSRNGERVLVALSHRPLGLYPASVAFAPTSVSDRMIRGTFDAVKVDIVAHPGEFRLGPPRVVEGLHVGSLGDIAEAKYKAITDRKQLRDFIDVMCVERDGGIALEQGLILYCRKHGVSFDLETVRTFLRHLGDFRYLASPLAHQDSASGRLQYKVNRCQPPVPGQEFFLRSRLGLGSRG